MKNLGFTGPLVACLMALFAAPVAAVTIDYSSISSPPSYVLFDPADNGSGGCAGAGTVGCFSFNPITNIEIDSGTAAGSSGAIGGTFGVGAISDFGAYQTAAVSGAGTLSITDATGVLNADLVWLDIATLGIGGIVNTQGIANLSNISYTGTNADLVALGNAPAGIQTATFQFTGVTSLTQLFTTNTGTTQTSFSGSITAVPVPAAVWLFGSGLLGMVGVARRRRS